MSVALLEQLDALAVGPETEQNSRVQLRNVHRNMVDQSNALLAKLNQPCVDVGDLEGNMVHHACGTLTLSVGDELQQRVTGGEKHQLFATEAEPPGEGQAKDALVELGRPREVRDMHACVMQPDNGLAEAHGSPHATIAPIQ
jgi:hypothetical protein